MTADPFALHPGQYLQKTETPYTDLAVAVHVQAVRDYRDAAESKRHRRFVEAVTGERFPRRAEGLTENAMKDDCRAFFFGDWAALLVENTDHKKNYAKMIQNEKDKDAAKAEEAERVKARRALTDYAAKHPAAREACAAAVAEMDSFAAAWREMLAAERSARKITESKLACERGRADRLEYFCRHELGIAERRLSAIVNGGRK